MASNQHSPDQLAAKAGAMARLLQAQMELPLLTHDLMELDWSQVHQRARYLLKLFTGLEAIAIAELAKR